MLWRVVGDEISNSVWSYLVIKALGDPNRDVQEAVGYIYQKCKQMIQGWRCKGRIIQAVVVIRVIELSQQESAEHESRTAQKISNV